MNKTWREHCKPIIRAVLKETVGMPEKEIKRALRNAYPYGERANHPYKIWCDEIRVQRGFRKFNERPKDVVPANQEKLF